MRKTLICMIVLAMVLSLCACGAAGGKSATNGPAATEDRTADTVFMAGFAMVDITPKESVPCGSSGNSRTNLSEGRYSSLEGRCVALQDPDGQKLLFLSCDLSWFPAHLAKTIREELSAELGIPADHIVLSGTHTHASVDTSLTDMPVISKYNDTFVKNMKQVAADAVADLKPARVYVGSVMTEGMNYVRRYFMDDGSLSGDNTYGTGTKRVAHETQADGEMQIMKFVREGGKDIVITQFQAHPHLEGESKNLSSQTVGAIRDAVEKKLDAHALHWQGAAGNVNSHGDLEGELPFERSNNGRIAYGNAMGDYVVSVYDQLTEVKTGKIQVRSVVYEGQVNHSYDDMTELAQQICDYFEAGNSPKAAADYAHELTADSEKRINSYYHANRILENAKLEKSKEMTLYAWSFGEVGGVVLPYELFDTNGMQIKEGSPFVRTFIVGYAYPAYGGYIPTVEAFANGGYEADNCTFVPGTAEDMVENYLNMLGDMHK